MLYLSSKNLTLFQLRGQCGGPQLWPTTVTAKQKVTALQT